MKTLDEVLTKKPEQMHSKKQSKLEQDRINKKAQRTRDKRSGLVRLELRVTAEQRAKIVAYMQQLVDEDS